MRVTLFRLVMVIITALIITALLWTPSAPDTLTTLQKTGTLRIGYAVEYPYAFVNEHRQVSGESTEIARVIARQLGVQQIEWIEMPFGQLIPNLQARTIDMIAGGMFITRERQRQVRFSLPTLQIYPGLLLPAANLKAIRQTDLDPLRSDIKLAVIEGAVEQQKLLQHADTTQILAVENLHAALDALDQQQADGILLSIPSLQLIVDSYPDDYQLIRLTNTNHQPFKPDYSAFAFHREDERLATAWNKALQKWLGSDAHLNIIAPYGFLPHNIPREASR